MDNNKIFQGISFDVSNYLIKRLKILVKSRKTFETWWIIVDEEDDTNERKMRREKEEEEEEKGKRGIFGIGLAGREAEEIGKRRWWPHVKSSCCPVSRRPGKVGAPGVAAVGNRPLPGSSAPVWIACRVDLRELPIATHGAQGAAGKLEA